MINKKGVFAIKLKGTEILMKVLEEEGVEIIFGFPGGAVIDIYDELVKSDKIKGAGKMSRLAEILSLYAGMDEREIEDDVEEKMGILDWMVKNSYFGVDEVGEIVSKYYLDPQEVIDAVEKGKKWQFEGRSR